MIRDIETKYADSTRQTLHPPAPAPKLEVPPVRIFVWNGVNNMGDQLNYLIMKSLKIRHMNTHFSRCNFIAIGSLLDQFFLTRDDRPKTQNPVKVWGSGFLAHPGEFGGDAAAPEQFAAPMEFAALRGKLSKERCEKILGRELGDIALGDPGLLIKRFFDTSGIRKEYDVGFVPHHSELAAFEESAQRLKKHSSVVIDATRNMSEVLRKIAACRVIVSSGLHGLIVADSFGIPNRRMILSQKPVVSDFKFADYDSVFTTPAMPPLHPLKQPVTDDQIDAIAANYRDRQPEITAICDRLLAAFPFKPAP